MDYKKANRYVEETDVIGLLTIIKREDKLLTCSCACGNICNTTIDKLSANRPLIKSCGCLFPQKSTAITYNNELFLPYIQTKRLKNAIGFVSGRLTITSILGKRQGRGNTIFGLVSCTCGTTDHIVDISTILSGIVEGCGCISREVSEANRQSIYTSLMGTNTSNNKWTYLLHNKGTGWQIQCSTCNLIRNVSGKYVAESISCVCERRNIDRLKVFVGTTKNWVTVLDLLVPNKGVTKFKCQCSCGHIFNVPCYYIEKARLSSCTSCATKYKSINLGGTGIPGETGIMSSYFRWQSTTLQWMNSIYRLYGSTCLATGIQYSTSEFLNIHHLEALNNICKAHNIVSITEFHDFSDCQKQAFQQSLLDVSNGIPLSTTLHVLLHKEIGKCPTKEQSLLWINNKRKENNLSEIIWDSNQNKYV